jgi:hypothetical protein
MRLLAAMDITLVVALLSAAVAGALAVVVKAVERPVAPAPVPVRVKED